MRRLLASLTVALFVVGCSQSPTAPVARVHPKVSLDCSNGNNGNNPPNTAGGGCNNNNNNNHNTASNNPPTTASN
jgi:PBP1b-binding outer membrane lipoprotein LpoB